MNEEKKTPTSFDSPIIGVDTRHSGNTVRDAWSWEWSVNSSKVNIYDNAKIRSRQHTISSAILPDSTSLGTINHPEKSRLNALIIFLSFCSLGFAVAILITLLK